MSGLGKRRGSSSGFRCEKDISAYYMVNIMHRRVLCNVESVE